MPKENVPPVVDEKPQSSTPPAPEVPRSSTKWEAFTKANLYPKVIACEGYRPTHRVNLGCHTRLVPSAELVKRHCDADHGGGFMLMLRNADKPWPGWAKFAELGLEASDLRCDVCDKQLPFHPQHILQHMKPHSGKSKRIRPGGAYGLTIAGAPPAPAEEDAFADFE